MSGDKSDDKVKSIDATPSKELFIDMLTRDIALDASILDLVDNSVDGARRMRGDKPFTDLYVRIKFSKNEFVIEDNCGGIPIDIAAKYAFRFGRPSEAKNQSKSVGRFGVGMKRAIFKIGREFLLESKTKDEEFSTDVNIDKWAEGKEKEWKFPFTTIDEHARNKESETGTTITIKNIRTGPSEKFEEKTFPTELMKSIKNFQSISLQNGLQISVNGNYVYGHPTELLSGSKIAPAYFEKTYTPKDSKKVKVRLYCGLGPSSVVADAGWHVYCNGRLILKGDKTEMTGWDSEGEEGEEIPAFHGQFNLIRGYAYFESEDAAALPWNTTKTGLNPDSGIYRGVRQEMKTLMRPVVDFCNHLKEEKEAFKTSGKDGPLTKLVDGAEKFEIESVATRAAFSVPASVTTAKPGPLLQRIVIQKPLKDAEVVKKQMKATSWNEVGEQLFDYYFNSEI